MKKSFCFSSLVVLFAIMSLVFLEDKIISCSFFGCFVISIILAVLVSGTSKVLKLHPQAVDESVSEESGKVEAGWALSSPEENEVPAWKIRMDRLERGTYRITK